jgi:hypothetical protein
MQYVFEINGDEIQWQVQYANAGATASAFVETGNAGPTNLVGLQSGNNLPQGYELAIDLLNDAGGNVNKVNFSVVDDSGQSTSAQVDLTANSFPLLPITSFQLNIVGLDNGAPVTFTQGAGNITYQASSRLCAGTETCPGSGGQTVENSNAAYSTIGPPCCFGVTDQFFTVP